MNTRSKAASQFDTMGLAMTGGGARGAYQAGVLKRIGEINSFRNSSGPFKIIGGASAGAVNGTAMAIGTHDFHRSTRWLGELWSNIKNQDVYRSDLLSLLPKTASWISDLGLGAFIGGGHANSLLDASPLRAFLAKNLKCDLIQKNIDHGNLRALSIAATNYSSGKTFLFVQSSPGHNLWSKTRRIALATEINSDHVCASAAIPMLFQAVKLETEFGPDYFGDGCLRLAAPLSPVIRLGADRILAIGVRSQKASEESARQRFKKFSKNGSVSKPPIAQIIGVTLNAIFLDHLDADVEHLNRLNQIIKAAKITDSIVEGLSEPMKIVKPLAITPSLDLGKVAENFEKKLPPAIRYMMAGLGTKESPSSDLLSYLLFDSSYTKALVNLGYNDAAQNIDEIEAFILDDQGSD